MFNFCKIIVCFFVGHKKSELSYLKDNHILKIYDRLGSPLLEVYICERCGLLYASLK